MSDNAIRIGDKVRVLADEPYDTHLRAGDIVTVVGVGFSPRVPGGRIIPVVLVSTNEGHRYLGADAVTRVTLPTYTPAEPDELYDAFFEKIMRADKGLHAIAIDAHNMLASPATATKYRDEDTSLTEEDVDFHDDPDAEVWKSPKGSHYTAVDSEDDRLDIVYAEHECTEHGREGAFFLTINDEQSMAIRADEEELQPLINFLVERFRFSRRPGDGTFPA